MKKLVIAGLAAGGLMAAYAEDIGVAYDANGDVTVAAGGEITVGPNGASTNNSQGVTVTFENGGTIKAVKAAGGKKLRLREEGGKLMLDLLDAGTMVILR